jgi:DNA-binding winged helix-turn-helix (wHTH) protein/TolB-like protein
MTEPPSGGFMELRNSFEFDRFRVDTLSRKLYRDDRPVQLTSKAFDTLLVLLKNAGEVVTKAELFDRVWAETAVEENNLTQQISALRKAFGEKASDHKFIVTVPGRGYCFVAAVKKRDDAPILPPNTVPSSFAVRLLNSNGFLGYAAAVIYILLICVPSVIYTVQAELSPNKPQTIAILRFRSAGLGDELLGMGIRDTLRAKLGSLDDVEVRPETPNSNSSDIVDAGRQMHADVVVTGSIQRDDDRIRVAIEMVDVTNERLVWGNTFDQKAANSFELQDSIANAVVTALKAPRLRSSIDLKLLQAS